jgi:cyclopropane fatty-acyl-phospholipid synthase-like methyltransferase
MSPESTFVDASQFTAVDQVSDPAAMIEMLDRLKRFLRAPKDTLLDRLALDGARAALDVGCGAGGDVVEMASRMPQGVRRSAWTPARR